MESKTALITGASSGIGYEIAKILAHKGYHLVLVANHEATLTRVAEELTKTYNITIRSVPKDLSSPSAAQELFDTLDQASIEIDILINNAGVGLYGSFLENDLNTELKMMQLNMLTLTSLTKLFVKKMLKKGKGKILNVASTVAFQSGPLMSVYYASKGYVLLFSEAIANELQGSGVTLSVLCPGPTRTEFQKRSKLGSSRLMSSKLFAWMNMDAQKVAEIAYEGLIRNKTIIIPGFKNRLLVFSMKLLPRKLAVHLTRMIQERKA